MHAGRPEDAVDWSDNWPGRAGAQSLPHCSGMRKNEIQDDEGDE